MLTDSLWSCNGKDPHHDQVQPEEPPARVGQNRLHPPEAVPALSPLRYHPPHSALGRRTAHALLRVGPRERSPASIWSTGTPASRLGRYIDQ